MAGRSSADRSPAQNYSRGHLNMTFDRLLIVLVAFIGSASAASAQKTPVAIVDVSLIDGTGSPIRQNVTVVIDGGRIVAVESSGSARVPPQARVIDGRGGFLIPGLWDMHVHLSKAGAQSLGLFVANGVTSVRDIGGDLVLVQQWRREIAAGHRIGPRITTAGPMLESAARVQRMRSRGTVEPIDRFRVPVGDATEAAGVVDSLAQLGADFVKVRTVASREAYLAIAAEARRVGLPLAAHGDLVPLEDMLQAQQRSVEHAIYPPLQRRDARTRAALIRELVEAQVAIVPTMANYYQWLLISPAEARKIIEDTTGRLDSRRRYISGYLLEDWREQVRERGRLRDALIRRLFLPRAYRGVLRDLQEMHRAGVRILPGTDVAVALMYPGFSLHDELGYFVDRIGMTPMEAILSATRVAAEYSEMADSLGTIEVGKVADLVLLDSNPLVDIRNVGQIRAVFTRGERLDRDTLDALLRAAAAGSAGRSGESDTSRALADESVKLTALRAAQLTPRGVVWRLTDVSGCAEPHSDNA